MSSGSGGIDLAVIGSGFGGLGAALRALERGRTVTVFEALNYPGGCASTFQHKGYRFEAGATLFSGFDPHQPFGRWLEELGLEVALDRIDPLVEVRTPRGALSVVRDRAEFAERLCAFVGERPDRVRAFLSYQHRIADLLWGLFEDPLLLPPLGFGSLRTHLRRSPRYLRLLRLVGRPLRKVLARFDLEDCVPMRSYLDAVCQITVQASSEEAEAPFALAAMDYFWRGTGHVRGGIGVLAEALVGALRERGAEVRMPDAVRGLRREGRDWVLTTRSGEHRASQVAANLLPQGLAGLLPDESSAAPRLERLAERVRGGWGACMLYRVVQPPADAPPKARHLQMVQNEAQPFLEGNHLFASISGAADGDRSPAGTRTMTVSTHVPLARWRDLGPDALAAKVEAVQDRMRAGLAALAPEWEQDVAFETSGSPRTFERFTRRAEGLVGGIPRRAGLRQYLDVFSGPVAPGLALVGDSVFPGQSTLAAALGGHRAVDRLL